MLEVGCPPNASPSATGPASEPVAPDSRGSWGRLTAGGVEGNRRLTTATAVLLLVLLAVEGVTILRLRLLLSVHMFVGMLLIPPVAEDGQHRLSLPSLLRHRHATVDTGLRLVRCA